MKRSGFLTAVGFVLMVAFNATGLSAVSSDGELSGVNRESVGSGFPGKFELVTQISILVPTKLVLSSGRYEMAYDEASTGVPSLLVGLAVPLFSWRRLLIYGQLQTGYSFKQSLFSVRTVDSGVAETRQQILKLHRVPVVSSVRFVYTVPGLDFVKPTLTIGAGAQWLHHSGDSGGLDGAYWVPYFFIAPSLTFFERLVSRDWFGGFAFGVSHQSNFRLTKEFSGWSFDLSANVLL